MKGLYDRDFTVLAPEEEQEKERIDAEENAARKTQFGRKNMFHYYPEAVRRYYASLFPNNFMDFMLLRDEKVLNAQCDGFEACKFVLWVGNKRLIKRRLFDCFVEQAYSI